MKSYTTLGALLVGALLSTPLAARETYSVIKEVFNCTSYTEECVVKENPGGAVVAFIAAAFDILEHKTPVRIIGECASACTMFADKARPYVCVTQDTVMRFHAASKVEHGHVTERLDVSYSDDLQAWINSRGGLPEEGLIVLAGDALLRYWPLCKS